MGGGPGRGGDPAIRARRAVALGALVVVLILIVVGVHSCQVSQANGALKRLHGERVRADAVLPADEPAVLQLAL